MKSWMVAVLPIAVLLIPEVAAACSVCFSARDENRIAFVVTTVLLSGLPLILVGGLVWWLRRRVLALERSRTSS